MKPAVLPTGSYVSQVLSELWRKHDVLSLGYGMETKYAEAESLRHRAFQALTLTGDDCKKLITLQNQTYVPFEFKKDVFKGKANVVKYITEKYAAYESAIDKGKT